MTIVEDEALATELAKSDAPVLRRLRLDLSTRLGLVLVALFVLMALIGPSLAPYDPLAISSERVARPSLRHILGTDGLGRDLFSRILSGARLSLGTTVAAALLVTLVGVTVGALAGFSGGLVDSICMRAVDSVLTIPALILALAITSMFDPGLLPVMLGLVAVVWAGYARIVRGLVMALKERSFLDAARASGAGPLRLVLRHILPNIVSPIVVLATLEFGHLLLAISTLTFLGLGPPPPTPEWGAMLNDGRTYFLSDPLVALVPGCTISLAVLAFNLVGDGLSDALDPRLAGQLPLRSLRRLRLTRLRRSITTGPPPSGGRARAGD